MRIELHKVKIKDLFKGYYDDEEEGASGYDGKLDIRPKYQRNFVYKGLQREEVIHTVLKGFPLNVMYWAKTGEDSYEVLDGQQRSLSICQFVNNDFSITYKGKTRNYYSLTDDERTQIDDYELMVYICEGTDSEKLDWFQVVNIAGEKLEDQELRNAVYTGNWLTDAKRHFSREKFKGIQDGRKFYTADINRQGLLELVLDWISDRDYHAGIITEKDKKKRIETYMANHQKDANCNDLWLYYTSVMTWIQTIFPVYRKQMKGQPWGEFYNQYKDNFSELDPTALEKRINQLMLDKEVENKKGIYRFVLLEAIEGLSPKIAKYLELRTFDDDIKASVYEAQHGKCNSCGKPLSIDEMHADHILPWSKGGKTEIDNCQMLCVDCNLTKSDKI